VVAEGGRLDWEDLRILLAVAREGTLTAAADALRISQPTAGRRLRALEIACGASLFQRTAHGFFLTDEGKIMRRHAERMEDEANALERRLMSRDAGLEGKLRLSASEWFARVVLTPAIAGFCQENPRVTIELVIESRIVDLERQEADLVFRFMDFDVPTIIQRRFMEVHYDLFASQVYLDRTQGLDDESAIHRLVGMDTHLAGLSDVAWLRGRYPEAAYSFCSNARDLQVEACAAGAGLAVLPTILGHARKLVALTHGDGPPTKTIRVGYHADLKRLKRLRALLDYLEKALPSKI